MHVHRRNVHRLTAAGVGGGGRDRFGMVALERHFDGSVGSPLVFALLVGVC